MKPTPILFLGDSGDLRTGLARIGRDLASLTSSLPEYRVGYLGRGGIGAVELPYAQYQFDVKHGFGDIDLLDRVWRNFTYGEERGIVFAIWDASRLGWLSCSEWAEKHRGKTKLLIYAPVDSAGPHGRLTATESNILAGFDEVLAYGEFGSEVLSKTLGRPIDWIPHGLDTAVFQPRDRMGARIAMGVSANQKLMGCVMTNQQRKDWGLAAQILAGLRDWHAWWHIDTVERHWNIGELISSYGLSDRVTLTFSGTKDDVAMSYLYSACDVTILPSSEGFGFPIAEALACGTPVIHSTYGGGNWRVVEGILSVQPVAMRLEGAWNTMRPVFDAEHWIAAVEHWAAFDREKCRASVEHLRWEQLWPGCWKKFMERLAK